VVNVSPKFRRNSADAATDDESLVWLAKPARIAALDLDRGGAMLPKNPGGSP
jgi:hypothetical protein